MKKPPFVRTGSSELTYKYFGPYDKDPDSGPHNPWSTNAHVTAFQGDPGFHRVNAYLEDTHVGALDMFGAGHPNHSEGYVEYIQVDPQHRLKGIGAGMYQHAKSLGIPVHHSNDLTPDGQEFTKHVSREI